MADVFIIDESELRAEQRVGEYLAAKGWRIKEVEHSERVDSASTTHDSRLAALFQAAQRDGIACIVSPYA